MSNDAGEFDVAGYGRKATKRQEGRDARPTVMLLRAEIIRRGCEKNGKPCKPRGWKYGDCVETLATCSLGFDWTDPEPVDQPVKPLARMSGNKEGARAINYIAANAAAYRKSKGVDSRQVLDAKMAKTPAQREEDSFWRHCADAVKSKGANPETDEMQVDHLPTHLPTHLPSLAQVPLA